MLIGAAIAAGLIVGILLVAWRLSDAGVKKEAAGAFKLAEQQEEKSFAGKWLVKLGYIFAGTPFANLDEESPGYRSLRFKIAASGNLFAGSVNVFVSTQIAACMLSAGALVVAMFSGLTGIALIFLIAFALSFAFWPYQRLTSTGKKRKALVDQDLPDFAELLVMPLSGGMGVLSSLDFAAKRSNNLVSQEVRIMLASIASHAVGEEEAFKEAGNRLGTSSAVAFFNTLAQSYTQGGGAADTLRKQAIQLRKLAYENTRAKLKLLPTKLVVVMGIHLMPTLFIVTLVPIAIQLTSGLGGVQS